jgi:hypothetical protein
MGVESEISRLGSATGIVAVDVSCGNQVLVKPSRGIMVTVAGNVAVTMLDGTTGVLPALNPGTLYPIAATSILQASTTATGIKVLT